MSGRFLQVSRIPRTRVRTGPSPEPMALPQLWQRSGVLRLLRVADWSPHVTLLESTGHTTIREMDRSSMRSIRAASLAAFGEWPVQRRMIGRTYQLGQVQYLADPISTLVISE